MRTLSTSEKKFISKTLTEFLPNRDVRGSIMEDDEIEVMLVGIDANMVSRDGISAMEKFLESAFGKKGRNVKVEIN